MRVFSDRPKGTGEIVSWYRYDCNRVVDTDTIPVILLTRKPIFTGRMASDRAMSIQLVYNRQELHLWLGLAHANIRK